MTESSWKVVEFPSESLQDALTAIRRDGARQVLARVIVEEVAEYVDARKPCQDEHGRQLVVRNGHLPPRMIQTPLGEIPAQAAAGARPAVRGRPREVHVVNSAAVPAAVPAEDELVGRAVSLALSQGHQHRGFQRGVAGPVGTRRARPIGETITRLKAAWVEDLPGLVDAVARGAAACLRLGRRRLLQRPVGGYGQQAPRHFGAHGCHPGTARRS